jgi:hypothetical protein
MAATSGKRHRSDGERALTLIIACSQHHDATIIANEALCNPAGLGTWPSLSRCHQLCLYDLRKEHTYSRHGDLVQAAAAAGPMREHRAGASAAMRTLQHPKCPRNSKNYCACVHHLDGHVVACCVWSKFSQFLEHSRLLVVCAH